MASRIQAINEYRPKIVLGRSAGIADLVELIASRTGLNESEVRMVLLELRDAVSFFNLQGQPVKLEGLGIYTPSIDLDGTLKVSHRADKELTNRLNMPGAFRGEITNRDSIGQSSDDLVARWNTNNPGDPVV
jgi:nucleoid DNA-binding protein